MTQEMIRKLLDICFLAKKITETIPELPKGLKPRHIHIITCVAEKGIGGEAVRVKDVSAELKVTMPSITKLINELEELKMIEKSSLAEDRRAAVLSLTVLGMQYYDTYVTRYHRLLFEELTNLDTEDCRTTIATIEALSDVVSKVAKGGFSWK